MHMLSELAGMVRAVISFITLNESRTLEFIENRIVNMTKVGMPHC
jgi:hypothetical protein